MTVLSLALAFALMGCSPVLNKELMREGAREFALNHVRETPEAFKGKLFILGGLIVETKLLEKGSQIEALYAPVDRYGYLKYDAHPEGRFIAFYPKPKGLLDPLIFKKGREITLAGEFVELRKGKIDEMEYVYPVFEIKQIYLWDERREYYPWPYSPYYYNYPFLYDPWGRPYPSPYWPPPPGW